VKGFYEGCKPFIGLNGCHIKKGKPEIILSVVARDSMIKCIILLGRWCNQNVRSHELSS